MSESSALPPRVTADIGGTHTRLALYDPGRSEFRCQTTLENQRYASLEAALEDWIAQLPEPLPRHACLAVAALIRDDQVSMTNRNWSFSRAALARRFNFDRLRVINDFEAHAHALPWLTKEDLLMLQPGLPTADAAGRERLAVIGPGTGLGGAILESGREGRHAVSCEPGHMNLAPGTPELLALWPELMQEHGRVHVELLLSGAGLARLYSALHRRATGSGANLSPADVTRRATDGTDPLCRETVELFCSLLGDVCADFVLATGAWGGLFLAGGILPRVACLLQSSRFLGRFTDRGPLGTALSQLPINLILHPRPGLVGTAHAPL